MASCARRRRVILRSSFFIRNNRDERPVGRCGRRVLCAVQAGVGIAFWAISTPAARSTGLFGDRRPPRMPQERRSGASSRPRHPRLRSLASRDHEGAFPPRRVPGSRIVGPFSVSRCARWITRSQIASATLGSPMAACHAVGGSWLAISVERAFAAIFDHLQQVPPLGIGERRQQPIVNREEIELRESAPAAGHTIRRRD